MFKKSKTMESFKKHLNELDSKALTDEKRRLVLCKLSSDISNVHSVFYGNVENEPDREKAKKYVSLMLNSSSSNSSNSSKLLKRSKSALDLQKFTNTNNTKSKNQNVFILLILNMKSLEFEAKKQAADILNFIIRRCVQNQCHILIENACIGRSNPIIAELISQFESNWTIAILQEIAKRPECASLLLLKHRSFVTEMMELMKNASFHIASDAFKTLQYALTRNHTMVQRYLHLNFTSFFENLNVLISNPSSFVSQRNALCLLSLLLNNEKYLCFTKKYVSNKKNLVIIMNLLRSKSQTIALEAFYVFRVFVANPTKMFEVQYILWNNSQHLRHYLMDKMQIPNSYNENDFVVHRNDLCKQLQAIEKPIKPQPKKKTFSF